MPSEVICPSALLDCRLCACTSIEDERAACMGCPFGEVGGEGGVGAQAKGWGTGDLRLFAGNSKQANGMGVDGWGCV